MEHDMEHGWLLHGTLARAKTPTANTPVSALQKEKRKTALPTPAARTGRRRATRTRAPLYVVSSLYSPLCTVTTPRRPAPSLHTPLPPCGPVRPRPDE